MRPFSTSVIGPNAQSIKLVALMEFMGIYWLINLWLGFILLEQFSAQRGELALLSGPAMPRLRVKPRRGAGWYAAAERRKRHRDFQSAVTLIRRRRRQAIRETSLPGTIVEEDPSIQQPPDFLHQTMVTFPDDWDPQARVFLPRFTTPGRTSTDSSVKASLDLDPGHCIIEEEKVTEADTVQDTDYQGNEEAQMKPPSPPLLLPEHLQLIFELRELAEDQIFRAVCASQ
jgi:hypothetical protein